MQKLKKALKKLTNLGQKTESKGPAKAAKKASTVKRKAQAASGGAKSAKSSSTAKKAAATKKAAASKAKATAKTSAKSEAKKKAPAKATAQAKASERATAKTGKKAAATKLTPAVKAPVAKASKARKKKEVEKPIPAIAAAPQPEEEIVLTDAEGRRYCRVKDCDQVANVEAYCRYHYLLYWKNIQNRKKILSEGKLERYIEELTARYPDKYLELLRKDLRSEKDFMSAIQELEIDDSSVESDFEDETQSYLDEVRGMSSEAAAERDEDF